MHPGHPLAQDDRCQDDSRHWVERRQDRGHRQRTRLDREDERAVARHVKKPDSRDRRHETPIRSPRGPTDHHDRADEDRLGRPDDHQRTEGVALADLGDEDAERADGHTRDEGEAESRGSDPIVANPRDQDDRRDGQPDADQDQRRGDPLQQDAGRDRDERCDDACDRGDHAHPADGQGLIQGRDPDPAGQTAKEAPDQIGRLWGGLAADDRESECDGRSNQLGEEHDAEQVCPTSQQTAPEVGRAPCERGSEAEDDGRHRAGDEVAQTGSPDSSSTAGATTEGEASMPSASTAVGPVNSTTSSAALS